MNRLLRRFKLSTRIMLLGIAIILCFSTIFIWLFPKLKNNMYKAKELKTRHLVEVAWTLADHFNAMAQNGTMSEADAQKSALEAIRKMRYEGSEYFWINNLEPRMIMHPMDPGLDGKDLSQKTDPNGKRMFVEMADICRSEGDGFVHYAWPKPGEPRPVPKISYVKLLPEWQWVIGSGIYVDDVEKEIFSIFLTIFFGALAVAGIGPYSLFFDVPYHLSSHKPVCRNPRTGGG